MIDPPNEGRDSKFSDLNMMVVPRGQERTRQEYDALFAAGGFRLVNAIPAGAINVIEGVPV